MTYTTIHYFYHLFNILILSCIQHPYYCRDPHVWIPPYINDYIEYKYNKPYENEKRTLEKAPQGSRRR
mgnify:FL=1